MGSSGVGVWPPKAVSLVASYVGAVRFPSGRRITGVDAAQQTGKGDPLQSDPATWRICKVPVAGDKVDIPSGKPGAPRT